MKLAGLAAAARPVLFCESAWRGALALVTRLIAEHTESGVESDYLFADGTGQKPISKLAMNMLLRRMGQLACTVHGFGSTLRD